MYSVDETPLSPFYVISFISFDFCSFSPRYPTNPPTTAPPNVQQSAAVRPSVSPGQAPGSAAGRPLLKSSSASVVSPTRSSQLQHGQTPRTKAGVQDQNNPAVSLLGEHLKHVSHRRASLALAGGATSGAMSGASSPSSPSSASPPLRKSQSSQSPFRRAQESIGEFISTSDKSPLIPRNHNNNHEKVGFMFFC